MYKLPETSEECNKEIDRLMEEIKTWATMTENNYNMINLLIQLSDIKQKKEQLLKIKNNI